MPLDERHGFCRQLFCRNRRFFGGLGSLLCGLPRLLCVLPFLLLFLPEAGQVVFVKLGMLLGGGPVLIIRRRLDIPGLYTGGVSGGRCSDAFFA